MINKVYKISDEEFINLIKSSLNIREVLFKLGYTADGNSWGTSMVKRRMQDLNLTGCDFKGRGTMRKVKEFVERLKPEEIFVKNCKHSRHGLRGYIIRHKLLPYKCAICGIDKWNGKTLSLEIDHINGVNNDNRLENLRFLCPNCHSQTTTYGIKNGIFEITEEIKKKIIEQYNIYGNAEKVARALNIPIRATKRVLSNEGLLKINQRHIIQYDNNGNETRRFGTIAECCRWLMENGKVKTKNIHTCRNQLSAKIGHFWNGFYYMDEQRIIHKLYLESPLIDLEALSGVTRRKHFCKLRLSKRAA